MSTTMKFTVKLPKRRNVVAQDMFDRDGPYRPRRMRSAADYTRKLKHKSKSFEFNV